MAKQFCSAFRQSLNITIASEHFRNKSKFESLTPSAGRTRTVKLLLVKRVWQEFFLANRKEQKMQIIIHIPARAQKYRLIIQTQLVEQLLTFYTDLFTLGKEMKHFEIRAILTTLIKQQICRSHKRLQTRTNIQHSF